MKKNQITARGSTVAHNRAREACWQKFADRVNSEANLREFWETLWNFLQRFERSFVRMIVRVWIHQETGPVILLCWYCVSFSTASASMQRASKVTVGLRILSKKWLGQLQNCDAFFYNLGYYFKYTLCTKYMSHKPLTRNPPNTTTAVDGSIINKKTLY